MNRFALAVQWGEVQTNLHSSVRTLIARRFDHIPSAIAPQDVLECFSQVRRVLRLLNADFLLRPVTATDELIAVSNLCDTNSPPMQELLMLERAEGEFAAAALSI